MISNKIIGASLGLAFVLGAAGIFGYNFLTTNQQLDQSNTDPLTELLGKDLRSENSGSRFKADFLTSGVFDYDGPVSQTLQDCIDSPLEVKPGAFEITAPYNPHSNITQSIDEILADINPVLGHAVRNQQINWDWDGSNQEYTFFGTPKDAKLWWCYFRKDTEFFPVFLNESEISLAFTSGCEKKVGSVCGQFEDPLSYFLGGEQNLKTFNNACALEESDFGFMYDGKCEDKVCTEEYKPICAKRIEHPVSLLITIEPTKTFSNRCTFEKAGQYYEFFHEGECDETPADEDAHQGGVDYSMARNNYGGLYNAPTSPNISAFAVLKADGSIESWGDSTAGGAGAPTEKGFIQIFSNNRAFAALKEDGSIYTWGDDNYGGTGAPTGTGFTEIFSNIGAFAALKEDGSIYAWGDDNYGGTGAPTGTGFTKIFSTHSSFAALKADGSIHAWGKNLYEETEPPTGTGFLSISTSNFAFAALKDDGSIHAWGNPYADKKSPAGTGFTKIQSTHSAFAALKEDGSIHAWGESEKGGGGAPTGTGFIQIFSNDRAFAALKEDGSIHVWGESEKGGSRAPSGTGFTKITATYAAFAALKADGSIESWGDSTAGGAGAPTEKGFIQIFSNNRAFAALKEDGSIYTWGDPKFGGNKAPTGTGFINIFSTGSAFAALKADGSIHTWGKPAGGGTGAPTATGYSFFSVDLEEPSDDFLSNGSLDMDFVLE